MFKLVSDRSTNGRDMRLAVVQTIQDLMKTNDKIVALEADLGGASKFTDIQKTNPDRFVQCGIAEADMIGIASGLSVEGFIPFVHTFAPFSVRRALDQIYLSGAYAKNTLNIYGSDPGFCVGANGGTHTTFEDMAIMRAIPNTIVIDPVDDVQLEWCIRQLATMEGVHYFRANRKAVRQFYQAGSEFTLGKGNVVKEGKDVCIIACGQLVNDAMDAALDLEEKGISCEVIDMFTIKPLDVDLLLKEIPGKKAVVTFENHSVIGGLGSAVSEVLAEHGIAVPFKRHGVEDCFGQVGSTDFLQKEFGLTSQDLEKTILTVLNR
ncbi:alpha-ketoacid dehydrogenase subunit beta [Firmicutes bacterium AM41-11]|nr:alpha-ketoacid dehydrogenase subunit beta [Firmicutes bacterium AM41-11]